MSAPVPLRTTPITLLTRRHAALWSSLLPAADHIEPSARAQAIIDFMRTHGASFFDELVDGTGLLRSQIEEALAELVAIGLVTSDSFGGLRALLVPSSERTRHRRRTAWSMERSGRWSLVHRKHPSQSQPQISPEAAEHLARSLLQRYGIMFGRLLEREPGWLPPWRDLLRIYRKLEARGEIRGGRFVAGFAGEQFVLPEAISRLREVRRTPSEGVIVSLSGADPLNLVGILTPGPKLPALAGNRLLYRDGVPMATLAGGEVTFLATLDPTAEWEHQKALLRSPSPGAGKPVQSKGMGLLTA